MSESGPQNARKMSPVQGTSEVAVYQDEISMKSLQESPEVLGGKNEESKPKRTKYFRTLVWFRKKISPHSSSGAISSDNLESNDSPPLPASATSTSPSCLEFEAVDSNGATKNLTGSNDSESNEKSESSAVRCFDTENNSSEGVVSSPLNRQFPNLAVLVSNAGHQSSNTVNQVNTQGQEEEQMGQLGIKKPTELPEGHLETYFYFMYLTGVSLYRREEYGTLRSPTRTFAMVI